MQILVDADACPVVIREILYRAAQKRELCLDMVVIVYRATMRQGSYCSRLSSVLFGKQACT